MAYDRNGANEPIPSSVFWLLAIWVIVVLGALVWGVDNAETTLRAEARASLLPEGHNVAVDFSGRDARLIGLVESEQISEEVAATVDSIDGVRLVKNEIVVVPPEPPPQRPPEIEVRLVGDAVSLAGAVPTEEDAAALVEAAAEVYGTDRVVNAIQVGPNVESEPWLGFVPGIFEHLTDLRSGGFTASGSGIFIRGEVVSEAVRDQLIAEVEVAIGDQLPVTAELAIAVLPPPTFSAQRRGGVVILEGTMPNRDTVDRIVEAAERLHPNATVVDALVAGDVAGPTWLESVEGLLDVVSRLESWTIEVADATALITGFGGDPDVVSAIDVLFAEVVGGELTTITAVEVEPAAAAEQLTALLEGAELFVQDSAALTEDGVSLLDAAVSFLAANPSTVLVVEGHTDDQGGAAANLLLSQQRAEAVVAYLVDGGIESSRLTAVGRGEEEPIAGNATEEGRAQNRRIVFVVRDGEG